MKQSLIVKEIFSAAAEAVNTCLNDDGLHHQVSSAAELMINALRLGHKLISCGNGGSHCDAMHFAEELSGRYRKDRKPLAAIAISDPSFLSCTANDMGFDQVFSRFVGGLGREGDVLVAFSTSGKSQNVLNAADEAKKVGMKVVSLTGRRDSALAKLADIDLCAPVGEFADRAQEIHIKMVHILIELIERDIFPENY